MNLTYLRTLDDASLFLTLDKALKAGLFTEVDDVLRDLRVHLERGEDISEEYVLNLLMSAAPKKARPHLPSLPQTLRSVRALLEGRGWTREEIASVTDGFEG